MDDGGRRDLSTLLGALVPIPVMEITGATLQLTNRQKGMSSDERRH
jgi:hypothetical protein